MPMLLRCWAISALEKSVRTFADGAEQSDDLTMLALSLKHENMKV